MFLFLIIPNITKPSSTNIHRIRRMDVFFIPSWVFFFFFLLVLSLEIAFTYCFKISRQCVFWQVIIKGVSSGTSIDLDDVSFSAHSCNEIPWAPYQGIVHYQSPGLLSTFKDASLHPIHLSIGLRQRDATRTENSLYAWHIIKKKVKCSKCIGDECN